MNSTINSYDFHECFHLGSGTKECFFLKHLYLTSFTDADLGVCSLNIVLNALIKFPGSTVLSILT